MIHVPFCSTVNSVITPNEDVEARLPLEAALPNQDLVIADFLAPKDFDAQATSSRVFLVLGDTALHFGGPAHRLEAKSLAELRRGEHT